MKEKPNAACMITRLLKPFVTMAALIRVSRMNVVDKPLAVLCLAMLFSILISSSVSAQQTDSQYQEEISDQVIYPRFGGPDTVENQLQSDRAKKDVFIESTFFDPYFDWKTGIKEKNGLAFGTNYTAVYLGSDDNLPGTDDYAIGGMVRFFGNWELTGRGTDTTGTLSMQFSHRHSGDTEPRAFSIASLGYVDSIASVFSDQGWRLTNFNWRQNWNNGQAVLMAGFVTAPLYVDVYGLVSPWLHFQSLAFSTGGGTMSIPGDAALGVIGGGWLTRNLYIMAGFEDANSSQTSPFDGFDTFFNDKEYFKHIEIGWTTAKDRVYHDNFHLTLWEVDERKAAGVESGRGGVLSFSRYVGDKWLPFIRAGWGKGGSGPLDRMISLGFAYQPDPIGATDGHLLGFGANWGRPNEASFGPGLDEQYGFELFYRMQITKQIAITPDIQLQFNPALNPARDSNLVVGLRFRLAL